MTGFLVLGGRRGDPAAARERARRARASARQLLRARSRSSLSRSSGPSASITSSWGPLRGARRGVGAPPRRVRGRAASPASCLRSRARGMAAFLLALPFFERQFVKPKQRVRRGARSDALDRARAGTAFLMALPPWPPWRHFARPAVAVQRAAVPWLAAVTLVAVGHLPAIDRFQSWQAPARAPRASRGAGPSPREVGTREPTCSGRSARGDRAVPRAEDPHLALALAAFLGPDRPRAALVTTTAWWDAVKTRAAGEPDLATTLASIRETYRDQMGQRVLVVLTNAPP